MNNRITIRTDDGEIVSGMPIEANTKGHVCSGDTFYSEEYGHIYFLLISNNTGMLFDSNGCRLSNAIIPTNSSVSQVIDQIKASDGVIIRYVYRENIKIS